MTCRQLARQGAAAAVKSNMRVLAARKAALTSMTLHSPQQGTPEGTTSLAHLAATVAKAASMPIFFDEQGTWMATLSRTVVQSSLSIMW